MTALQKIRRLRAAARLVTRTSVCQDARVLAAAAAAKYAADDAEFPLKSDLPLRWEIVLEDFERAAKDAREAAIEFYEAGEEAASEVCWAAAHLGSSPRDAVAAANRARRM